MKPPMLATADMTTLDEQSDVHEHTRPDAFRPPKSRVSYPPPPPPAPSALRHRAPPPPPPPPPRAASTLHSRPSLWFLPSLAAVLGLCVVGVLALIRLGPSATREKDTPGPIASALEPAETTQVSAAQDPPVAPTPPVWAERAAPPATGCVEQAAAEPEPAAALPDDEPQAPIAQLSQRSRRSNRGLLLFKSNVPSAVYVDGRMVGNSARRRVSLPPGRHEVALENAVTDQRAKFSIVVAAGSVVQRKIRLPRAER
jgi:hypothetical protein